MLIYIIPKEIELMKELTENDFNLDNYKRAIGKIMKLKDIPEEDSLREKLELPVLKYSTPDSNVHNNNWEVITFIDD